jgi:hypothetical protein
MWPEEQEKHQPAIAAPRARIFVFGPVCDDFVTDRALPRGRSGETKKYDQPLFETNMLV